MWAICRVFKQKQPHHNLSRSTPEGGLEEKNRSDVSLAPSDQRSEELSEGQDEKLSISNLPHTEVYEQNLPSRKLATAQVRK